MAASTLLTEGVLAVTVPAVRCADVRLASSQQHSHSQFGLASSIRGSEFRNSCPRRVLSRSALQQSAALRLGWGRSAAQRVVSSTEAGWRNFSVAGRMNSSRTGGKRGEALPAAAASAAAAAETAEASEASGAVCNPGVLGLCDTVVGVLGGGQLGRMICQAASPMGIRVAVLDPAEDAPAAGIAFEHVRGSFRDAETIKKFAQRCGVLTVEIEHVDADGLAAVEMGGGDVEPRASTIRIIQDKFQQKCHFASVGVPLPEFRQVDSLEDARAAGEVFGYPLMLKSRRMAYDGRGNAVARSAADVEKAVASLGGKDLYAEKWAPFVKELAVMVARGRDGSVLSYPVVETTHRDNICHVVEAPAQVPVAVRVAAREVAERAVASLAGAGVIGVELFLLADGSILLNEVAPRPHNSGHYTIEACETSQYEQHLRAVLGLPLGSAAMKVPAAIMLNVLGEEDGEEGMRIANAQLRRAAAVPGASVHWYEKSDIRKQRKMGHITVVGPDIATVRRRAALIQGEGEPENVDLPAGPVSIIMGSDSDLPVMKAAAEVLEEFGVGYEITVVSAHRTPERMVAYARGARERGFKVIIAGAGGAAHLPGMVAALTPLPVIGVPVRASTLDGMDSLLSIVQMPRGVPVATVAINNAMNAGLLAVRLLGAADPSLLDKMEEYQEGMRESVTEKAESLQKLGWKEYLHQRE